ncbi:OB-fold nucleic acid binding domain-containing protein, partial [Intestinimonas butyriciproducens]
MEFLKGMKKTERLELKDIIGGAHRNETVQVSGMVHAKRPVGGGLTFLKLRKRDGLLQCTCGERVDVSKVPEESAVVVTGRLREELRAPGGVELVAEGIEVLSRPAAVMPVPIPKAKLNVNLDTELGLRPVVLRHLRERSVFRVQECLGRAFRDYLRDQGFTEIHTPKIVHAGAEGGSNIFRLDYF